MGFSRGFHRGFRVWGRRGVFSAWKYPSAGIGMGQMGPPGLGSRGFGDVGMSNPGLEYSMGITCSLHCSSFLGLPYKDPKYKTGYKPKAGTTIETIGMVHHPKP